MSDPRIKGPFSALAVPIGDELHRPKSPFERAFARASFGAFLLTWCIYTAATLGHAASEYPPAALWIWAGCTCFSVLLVWLGLRSPAREPRDIVRALFSIAPPVGIGWALWTWIGPQLFDNFYVRGFFLAWGVGGLVEAWCAMRGTGAGDAQRNVRRHIEQNQNVWRSDRRK